MASSHGGGLVSIRAEVAAFVAAAQVIANQAVASAATTQTAEAALHLASEAARREVTSFVQDFYEKKIFDPFLRFASPEDEDAYRKREADRERAIKEALALGTPEGNLRAANLSMAQLRDAGAHGADKSPEYARIWSSLDAPTSDLKAQLAVRPETEASIVPAAEAVKGVDPVDPIAVLRAAGVAVADQTQEGHGVTVRETRPPAAKTVG